jgi:hypothetical protein
MREAGIRESIPSARHRKTSNKPRFLPRQLHPDSLPPVVLHLGSYDEKWKTVD